MLRPQEGISQCQRKIKDFTFKLLVKASDNKQWMNMVEEELTLAGFSLYLDENKKNQTDTHTSAGLVVKLLNALDGSDYSYLSQHKDKTIFVDVWKLVKQELTNKTAIYSETMQFWKHLFQNSAQSRDDFMSYYNVFKTNVHKLSEHKSKAVQDNIFLRASTFSQLDIPDDKDLVRKLLRQGSPTEAVDNVMDSLKETFAPVDDSIDIGDRAKVRRTPSDGKIPRKVKQAPPPPRPKLPLNNGDIIPGHLYASFAGWFQVMSNEPDPSKWSVDKKKKLQALKSDLEGMATKAKNYKKLEKEGKKTLRRRLEVYEPTSGSGTGPGTGSQAPPAWSNDSSNARRGPTSEYQGRGRGRGVSWGGYHNDHNSYGHHGGPFRRY